MAAPTAFVTGTFKNAAGTVLANRTVYFYPQLAPAANNGDIILRDAIAATLNGSGVLGPLGDFKLVAGVYKVVVSDKDSFTIAVPGDGLLHDIATLGIEIANTIDYLYRVLTDSATLGTVIKGSGSVDISTRGNGHSFVNTVAFFGEGDSATLAKIARFMVAEDPGVIVGLGNLNPGGLAGTIDANIGQHFNQWIRNYSGAYGSGATSDRFLYALGSQDWIPGNVTAVTNFFTFPSPERYYKVTMKNAEIFVVDSNASEPSGNTYNSVQGQWLQTQLAASGKAHRIVCFRDAVEASVSGYSNPTMLAWPFASWGATAVISAGPEVYERLERDGIRYFVVGTANATLGTFGTPLSNSEGQYNSMPGFLRAEFTEAMAKFSFVSIDGEVQDYVEIPTAAVQTLSPMVKIEPRAGLTTTGTGVSLEFGARPKAVLEGPDIYERFSGQVTRVASTTAANALVVASQWFRNNLFIVGDDPAFLAYYNRAQGTVNQMTAPFRNSYYNGSRPKIANPTLSPASGEVANGVTVGHADSGVTIKYSINAGDLVDLGWPTNTVIPLDTKLTSNWVVVIASKTGSEDSDAISGKYYSSTLLGQ